MKSLKQRKTNITDIAYMWYLKKGTNELTYKTELQMQKTNMVIGG